MPGSRVAEKLLRAVFDPYDFVTEYIHNVILPTTSLQKM